jgi:hypothetical protein
VHVCHAEPDERRGGQQPGHVGRDERPATHATALRRPSPTPCLRPPTDELAGGSRRRALVNRQDGLPVASVQRPDIHPGSPSPLDRLLPVTRSGSLPSRLHLHCTRRTPDWQ